MSQTLENTRNPILPPQFHVPGGCSACLAEMAI